MRLISAFRQAPERALLTLRRFPVVLVAGAFLAAVIMIEPEGALGERLVMTALLAVIVAFDLTLVRERLGVGELVGHGAVAVLSAAVLAGIFAGLDVVGHSAIDAFGRGEGYATVAVDEPIRIGAIALGLHALAAVIPFLGRRSLTGFWDYNRTLFLRILSSLLFSGVLYAGLAGALLALDALLGVEVGNDAYTDLFAVMAGIVNTWFFLAGVPAARVVGEDEAVAVAQTVYPRGLKAFVQFVLLPLTAVYLVILYLYTGRILLEWNLPQGQVSWLIFSYAVMGILAYLLIFPLREDEENRWIRTFARGFFIALAPLLVVLAVALVRRVNDYGLTEPRYYGLALAAWLAVIVAYFLTRREDIRVIPITLGIASLLTTVGPWGATSVAVRSQVAQLEAILERPKPLSDEHNTTVRSIAAFLEERGRLADGAALVTKRPDTVRTSADLATAAGVDPAYLGSQNQNLHFSFTPPPSIDLRGFSDMIEISGSFDTMSIASPELGTVSLRWRHPGILMVIAGGDSVALRLDSVAGALMQPVEIIDISAGDETRPETSTETQAKPESSPTPRPEPPPGRGERAPHVEATSGSLRARLVLRWLAGSHRVSSDTTANDLSGSLFVGRNDDTTTHRSSR